MCGGMPVAIATTTSRCSVVSPRAAQNESGASAWSLPLGVCAWAAAHAALSACWEIADGRPITHQLACLPHLLSAYDQA